MTIKHKHSNFFLTDSEILQKMLIYKKPQLTLVWTGQHESSATNGVRISCDIFCWAFRFGTVNNQEPLRVVSVRFG